METQMVFSHLSIKPGECIKVKGKVPPEAKSFALNLCHDDSDTILHFNPRFDSHGDVKTIVCNSKSNGQWDSELRESVFPFQQGEDTKVSRNSLSTARTSRRGSGLSWIGGLLGHWELLNKLDFWSISLSTAFATWH
uniref:Galectin n=1 Tax=Podarcis muralis TaxID=64176 RepID=A0A670HX17_PODMU